MICLCARKLKRISWKTVKSNDTLVAKNTIQKSIVTESTSVVACEKSGKARRKRLQKGMRKFASK